MSGSPGIPVSAREIDEISVACGLPLAAYRPEHVGKQLRRAAARRDVELPLLASQIDSDPDLRATLRRAIANSVTGLFRDPQQFELLEQELLPPLVRDRPRLRVWSAGSADGSEMESMAILLDRLGVLEEARLLGSDLLEENVAAARARPAAGTLLAHCRWERRDLTRDEMPAGRWDLILCRNLAIYLRPAERDRLHARLAACLDRGGLLLLGRSERVADPTALGLERVAPHAYRRSDGDVPDPRAATPKSDEG